MVPPGSHFVFIECRGRRNFVNHLRPRSSVQSFEFAEQLDIRDGTAVETRDSVEAKGETFVLHM
jgi:hypothetical protein